MQPTSNTAESSLPEHADESLFWDKIYLTEQMSALEVLATSPHTQSTNAKLLFTIFHMCCWALPQAQV